MTNTFSKPSLFSDYFTNRKAQKANDSLVQANALILAKNRMFSTIKRLELVTLMTNVENNTNPIFFHSLFEPAQPRKEDESWSTTTWHCALTGFFNTIKAVKIN